MKNLLKIYTITNYYLAALLLVWAGAGKMLEPGVGDLLETLFDRRIITLGQLIFISRWHPPLEIALGLFALSGIKAGIAARIMGVVYLFFVLLFLIVSEGHFLQPVDCGCFGEGNPTPVYLLILRNTIIAIPLFFFPGAAGAFTRPRLLFQQN
ncbi:MAG: hypothetical protein HY885_03000 [Deltaproteobacteria bacterium]|nr:hypothetical protein [Deltaproteobacteria bacterium]